MYYKEYQGNIGEELVKEQLKILKGGVISGFIRTKNLEYFGKNFQVDFLVFVPKIGILVLEVKKWKGEIKATCEEKWVQEIGNNQNEYGNASMQVLRTAGLLMQILEKEKLNKWPIRPIVIFTDKSAHVLKAKGEKSPQTDIILLSMLAGWIEKNSTNEIFYQFSEWEFNAVKQAVIKYTKEYE